MGSYLAPMWSPRDRSAQLPDLVLPPRVDQSFAGDPNFHSRNDSRDFILSTIGHRPSEPAIASSKSLVSI